MIYSEDYEEIFNSLGSDFFIQQIQFVPDLKMWSEEKGESLDEPYQLMKLVAGKNDILTMYIQSNISEEVLNDIIKALNIRWALKDVASDLYRLFNSSKKRLAYCFMKEYSRTLENIGGNELQEDEWSIREMEKLGFFNEYNKALKDYAV